MADLIDRLSEDSQITGRPEISAHHFTAYVVLWAVGHVTDQQMVSLFNLVGDELRQANQIKTTYNGKNATTKLIYINAINALFIVLNSPPEMRINTSPYFNSDGTVIKSEIFSDLEIAG